MALKRVVRNVSEVTMWSYICLLCLLLLLREVVLQVFGGNHSVIHLVAN